MRKLFIFLFFSIVSVSYSKEYLQEELIFSGFNFPVQDFKYLYVLDNSMFNRYSSEIALIMVKSCNYHNNFNEGKNLTPQGILRNTSCKKIIENYKKGNFKGEYEIN